MQLRRAWAAHSAAKARAASFAQGSAAPAFAGISAAALRLLVDTAPLPFAIIDCRPREEARASPAPFKDALLIPGEAHATAQQQDEGASMGGTADECIISWK